MGFRGTINIGKRVIQQRRRASTDRESEADADAGGRRAVTQQTKEGHNRRKQETMPRIRRVDREGVRAWQARASPTQTRQALFATRTMSN
jgi:hypothetical protein